MIVKNRIIKTLIVITTLSVLLSLSCTEPGFFIEESEYKPILISREEANKEIKFVEPRSTTNGGKSYISGDFFYQIDEEGIHVYDNSNSLSPINIGFIYVRNISDMSIIGDILFANQSTDLVGINIADLNAIYVTGREIDAFNDLPPDNRPLKEKYIINRPPNTIVAEWILETNE